MGFWVVRSAYGGGGGGMAQSVRVFVWIFLGFLDAWVESGSVRLSAVRVKGDGDETDRGVIGVPFRETGGRIGYDSRHR